MIYQLYVDNFRGFTDTCIPITDVNFLVGENSTGKSSILGLIKLFSGPSFLMGREFAHSDVGFGHYFDIVSAHSDDQSYFRVGFVSQVQVPRNGGRVTIGSLFTFKDNQGQPQVSRCTFRRSGEEISIKLGSSIYFKITKCDAEPTPEDIVSCIRSKWNQEHSSGKDTGYTKLDVPPGAGGNIPVLIALSLVHGFTKGSRRRGSKTKEEFIFQAPDIGFAPPDLTWFSPIRTKAKRTYDEPLLEFSPEGQHTPYLIRRMLKSKAHATKLKEFIDKVGKASGLFQDVKIKSFGQGQTARFELDIVLDGKALNILNVGYGVSQSLPIIVELLARPHGTWFAIQEPEIHLHPRAQAVMGDVLFEMATLDHKRFLVETHSDFTIDRFRMKYKNGRSSKLESQILFFERKDKHNVVTSLPISKTGDLPADQPPSYRQFFIREQMNMLGI
jgi:hypothetical protein